MAKFPQQYFTKDNVLVRTGPSGGRERYASQPFARKFIGPPKGVYHGFTPSAIGSVLTLTPSIAEGVSLAKLHSSTDPAGLDVTAPAPITIDYSTALLADFQPDGVQVILKASFIVGQTSTARIVSRTQTSVATVATIGVSPTTLDLSTLELDPIAPGTISIALKVSPSVLVTLVTDDGAGNIPVSAAMPTGGLVDYETGAITGVTAPLTALSTVVLTYTRTISKDEVLLCVLTGTPAAIVVNASPGVTQDVPIAFPGTDFGFMAAGSMELLASVVDTLNEVIAARVDIGGTTHPSLKDRLDYDLSAPAMAARLSPASKLLRSNDYTALSSTTQLAVGGSLTKQARSYLPLVTVNGGGSEAAIGAVTDPPDSTRNVCFIIDKTTGDRLIADTTSREVVFGRLKQDPDILLNGTLTFASALSSVTGDVNARMLTQLSKGDLIQGPDGEFYEVASVQDNAAATLTTVYQGVNASSGGLIRRRFYLRFRKFDAGTEKDHTLTADTQLRFFFPAFINVAQSNFDAEVIAHAPGERPLIPDATTTLPGKVALTSASLPLVGTINLQVGGSPVVGGPFHTIDFTAPSANVTETSPGVVDVLNIGPTGVQPTGLIGPPGPPGPIGPSYDITKRVPFVSSGVLNLNNGAFPGFVAAIGTFTHDFGFTIGFLSGGIAKWKDQAIFVSPNDQIEIVSIGTGTATTGVTQVIPAVAPSTTAGTIIVRAGNGSSITDTSCILYLDAAGR